MTAKKKTEKPESKITKRAKAAEEDFLSRYSDFEGEADDLVMATEIEELPENEYITGEFVGTEFIDNPKKNDDPFYVVVLKTIVNEAVKVVRYWGFGLLKHLLEKAGVAEGDMLRIKKLPQKKTKDGMNAWGVELSHKKRTV